MMYEVFVVPTTDMKRNKVRTKKRFIPSEASREVAHCGCLRRSAYKMFHFHFPLHENEESHQCQWWESLPNVFVSPLRTPRRFTFLVASMEAFGTRVSFPNVPFCQCGTENSSPLRAPRRLISRPRADHDMTRGRHSCWQNDVI
jgi:hypothetical protein